MHKVIKQNPESRTKHFKYDINVNKLYTTIKIRFTKILFKWKKSLKHMLFIKELFKQSDILKAKQKIKDKGQANTIQREDRQRIKIKR